MQLAKMQQPLSTMVVPATRHVQHNIVASKLLGYIGVRVEGAQRNPPDRSTQVLAKSRKQLIQDRLKETLVKHCKTVEQTLIILKPPAPAQPKHRVHQSSGARRVPHEKMPDVDC